MTPNDNAHVERSPAGMFGTTMYAIRNGAGKRLTDYEFSECEAWAAWRKAHEPQPAPTAEPLPQESATPGDENWVGTLSKEDYAQLYGEQSAALQFGDVWVDEKFSEETVDALLDKYQLKQSDALAQASAPARDERVSDKPPVHFAENDGWKRHPQTNEEWDWHADGPENNPLARSIKRLNFASDRSDPHAPDQMALVLRIDLMRALGQLAQREAQHAYWKQKREQEAAQPSEADTISAYGPAVSHKYGEPIAVMEPREEGVWVGKGALDFANATITALRAELAERDKLLRDLERVSSRFRELGKAYQGDRIQYEKMHMFDRAAQKEREEDAYFTAADHVDAALGKGAQG